MSQGRQKKRLKAPDRKCADSQLSIKFITYFMADPLHLYYKPDLASSFRWIEDSQQIYVKYNLLV